MLWSQLSIHSWQCCEFFTCWKVCEAFCRAKQHTPGRQCVQSPQAVWGCRRFVNIFRVSTRTKAATGTELLAFGSTLHAQISDQRRRWLVVTLSRGYLWSEALRSCDERDLYWYRGSNAEPSRTEVGPPMGAIFISSRDLKGRWAQFTDVQVLPFRHFSLQHDKAHEMMVRPCDHHFHPPNRAAGHSLSQFVLNPVVNFTHERWSIRET